MHKTINSSSTKILPAEVKFVVEASVIFVPDPPVPFVSFNSAPFKVDVAAPATDPFAILIYPNHNHKIVQLDLF